MTDLIFGSCDVSRTLAPCAPVYRRGWYLARSCALYPCPCDRSLTLCYLSGRVLTSQSRSDVLIAVEGTLEFGEALEYFGSMDFILSMLVPDAEDQVRLALAVVFLSKQKSDLPPLACWSS